MLQILQFYAFIWLAVLICAYGKPYKPYYWTTRTLQCQASPGHDRSRCVLRAEGNSFDMNPECFETNEYDNARTYCRIGCEESADTTVVTKLPTWNHLCNMFYTYNLQRFRRDWYLWRSNDCLNTTIAFEIRCGFEGDQRNFYQKNRELFLQEDELDRRERLKVGY